jgi:hypothetical protein
MDDLIGAAVIGVQYWLGILVASRYLGTELPREAVIGIFLAYAGIGIAIWQKKKEWQRAVATWAKLSLASVIAGIVLIGVDSLLGYSEGAKPVFIGGGLLGFPLTVLVCPPFTMICVAGLVRALYVSRMEGG